jgi:hypothetical protein
MLSRRRDTAPSTKARVPGHGLVKKNRHVANRLRLTTPLRVTTACRP